MDKDQAKTVADVVLEPHLQEQQIHADRFRKKKTISDANRRRGRIAIWFLLAGAAVGAATAYFIGSRVGPGLLWGLNIGGLLGWAVAYAKVRTAA